MPNGKTHDRITFVSSPLIAITTAACAQSIDPQAPIIISSLLTTGGFIFAGLMFGPDLDLHSNQYNRWGILRYMWKPYQKLLSHRSLWSHGPLIGTAIRIVYLALWIIVFGFISIALLVIGAHFLAPSIDKWVLAKTVLDYIWQPLKESFQTKTAYWLYLIIGLELGAASHYMADSITSWFKQNLRR